MLRRTTDDPPGGPLALNKILVLSPPEDRASRALGLAGALAADRGVRVTLLRVLTPVPEPGAARQRAEAAAASTRLRDLLIEAETRQLEEAAGRLRSTGVDVRVEIDEGVPWQRVVDRVTREGYDLVVKAATGLVRSGRIFFGATALHLFRRCPCPVWVVGDDARLPERVVAAVDPTAGARRHHAAHAVLDWSDWIAEWIDAPAHLVSAWQALDWALPDPDGAAREELKRHREAVRSEAELALNAMLEERGAPFAGDRVHLIEGSPTEVRPRFTAGRASDLIVMGTLGRPDVVGDLIGETAETMIRNVHCSVLTVPPGSRADAPVPHPDPDLRSDRGAKPGEGVRS